MTLSKKTYPPFIDKAWGKHLGYQQPQPPVWYYTNKVMRLLGIKEKQMYMYIKSDETTEVILENTSPASLIISQRMLDLCTETELNFVLAKYLFYISQRQTLALKMTPEDLEVYFKLLRSCFVPLTEEISPDAKALQKQIQKGLSWSVSGTLKTRNDLWDAVSQINTATYLKCLEYSSNRLALLVTDSLDLAMNMIVRLDKLSKGEPIEKRPATLKELQECDGVSDILYFNMSDQYSKIRKLCGLSID